MRRRRFLASSAGVGVGLLAGCSGSNTGGTGEIDGDGASGDGGDGDGETETTSGDGSAVGSFRLLISDRPAAIGDFDSLNVSFSKARIFRAGGGATEEADATEAEPQTGTADTATPTASTNGTETATDTANGTATETVEPSETPEATETPESEDADGDDDGFVVRDLGGATVDLTQVVGEKAIGVLDGELSAGRYSKIELYAASVEGIVDGEAVDVKIPSGKLQLTKPFEVVAGESVSFVFDINVVKKGNGGYNLLPVISESGVAGTDVTVEEVGADGSETPESETEASETPEEETTEDEATEQESETETPDEETDAGQSGNQSASENGNGQ